MNQKVTKAIILSRTDYGEADRIITVLSEHYGKLRLMAKGVRKIKSKLAGGIELFSVSDITFISGRGEVGTLISSRLNQHFGRIVEDMKRVQLGYDLIKLLNKTTEDDVEAEYFILLKNSFEGLDTASVSVELVSAWFKAQLLRLAGYTPNLQTDMEDLPLVKDNRYIFDIDSMALASSPNGTVKAEHIKILRLFFGKSTLKAVSRVEGINELIKDVNPLVSLMFNAHLA